MAASKKPAPRKRTTAKKPTRAVGSKAAQEKTESNRIFGMTLVFTLLALIFLLFSMMRYS